jgi:ElaB/YqjD/DUF883 family membrane-anchored ribosome-binding protein
MSKKWYNYFVSVDEAEAQRESAAAGVGSTETTGGPPSAAQTVAEIAAMVNVAPKLQGTISDPTSFEQIYQAAEIAPPAHGFTIFKIADMLKSEHIRSLPIEIKRSSVLLALDAAGVKLQDMIQDAVRRDRALDTFEAVQQRALEQLEAATAESNRKLQEEADGVLTQLRTRMQAGNDEVTKARERMQTWRLQKQQEEKRIADAVTPFVSENPITTGPAAAARDIDKKPS